MNLTYIAHDAYVAASLARVKQQTEKLQKLRAIIDASIVSSVHNGELNMEIGYDKSIDITEIRHELHEAGFQTSIKNWSQDVNQLVVSWSHF